MKKTKKANETKKKTATLQFKLPLSVACFAYLSESASEGVGERG